MKRHVQIRFLQPGLIDVEAPENWNTLTSEEKEQFCLSVMKSKTDQEFIEGMREVVTGSRYPFFAGAQKIEAVEIADEHGEVELVASTRGWDSYAYSNSELTW